MLQTLILKLKSFNVANLARLRRITPRLKREKQITPGDSSRYHQQKFSEFAKSYLNDDEFERVKKRVARAAVRVFVDDKKTPTGLSTLGLLVATLAPWVVGFIYAHLLPIDYDLHTGAFTAIAWIIPVFCGMMLFGFCAIAYLGPKTNPILPPGREFVLEYRFRIISVSTVATSFVFWILIQNKGESSLTVQDVLTRFAIGGIAYLTIAITLAVIIALGGNFLDRNRPPLAHPHDRLLLDMVNICAVAQKKRLRWNRSKSIIAVLEAIERAARRAENFPYYVGPLFFSGQRTRVAVANDGLAIAALIRDHQRLIIRANGPDSYGRVIESICAGIVALVDDDWESLMAHTVPVSGVSRFRSAVQRIFPPVILLAAAFIIPLIPQVASSPAVAGSVRVTLMVTAALALVLPRESSARAPILDALSKAAPISKSDK